MVSFSASIVPAIFVIAASYAGCDELLVVILLSISTAGQGFDTAGTVCTAFDLGKYFDCTFSFTFFTSKELIRNLFPQFLAPNYIGPINAVAFTVSSVASISAPYAVGFLTPHVSGWLLISLIYMLIDGILTWFPCSQAYLSEWRLVFWLTFVFFMAKAVIFTIWGSAKVQPWNSPEKLTPNA